VEDVEGLMAFLSGAVMTFDIETMKSQLDQFSELVEICRKEVS
jgi:hypothetical protein